MIIKGLYFAIKQSQNWRNLLIVIDSYWFISHDYYNIENRKESIRYNENAARYKPESYVVASNRKYSHTYKNE